MNASEQISDVPAAAGAPRVPSLRIAGAAVTAYLLAFGAALAWRLAGDAGDAILCIAPVILGAALSMTSQADRKQYIARLLAAGLFLPVLLMMWASSHDRAGLWLLAFVVLHLAAFVALIAGFATLATRVEAAAGVAPVGEELLLRRLASLANGEGPLRLVPAAVRSRIQFDLQTDESRERRHRVVLDIDAIRHTVGVREILGAEGAAPRTYQESSMRAGGEPWFDPSRPEAQAVWSRTWQSTMIDPGRLAHTLPRFDLDRVAYRWPPSNTLDSDAVMTLLAAVVTRSGYAWRPRLLPAAR